MSHFSNSVSMSRMPFTPTVHFQFLFLRFSFSNVLFWLALVHGLTSVPWLFLPISFQLSCLSVTHVSFSQFGASYFTRIIYTNSHIPTFPLFFLFPIFSRCPVVFSQFGTTYFTRAMYTNCQILNFLLVCFSASPFSVLTFLFIVSEIPYQLSSLGIPFEM